MDLLQYLRDLGLQDDPAIVLSEKYTLDSDICNIIIEDVFDLKMRENNLEWQTAPKSKLLRIVSDVMKEESAAKLVKYVENKTKHSHYDPRKFVMEWFSREISLKQHNIPPHRSIQYIQLPDGRVIPMGTMIYDGSIESILPDSDYFTPYSYFPAPGVPRRF